MSRAKIIVILGPTASGKTKLGVALAAKFNGEIVSADSRQVYKGLDIGSGKDLEEYAVKAQGPMTNDQEIQYHLIDIAEPNEVFDLAQYQKMAYGAIEDILKRGKLPIVVGGSGLYLQAIVDGFELPAAKPDNDLRQRLEQLTLEEIQQEIVQVNPGFFEKLNNSEKNNQRRLIRYLEVLTQPVPAATAKPQPRYESLLIGLDWPKEVLAERIQARVKSWLDAGLIDEVQSLAREGVSWQRLEGFGLEYKLVAQYLQDKLEYDELAPKIELSNNQFVKRQMTWFKRWAKQGKEIHWLTDINEASQLVENFI